MSISALRCAALSLADSLELSRDLFLYGLRRGPDRFSRNLLLLLGSHIVCTELSSVSQRTVRAHAVSNDLRSNEGLLLLLDETN